MSAKKNILVTGATGFVGKKLVQQLFHEENKIRILRQGPLLIPQNWMGEIEIRDGDLTHPETLAGIADGIETVYHLAGEIREKSLYDAVNRVGTENLLDICRNAGVKKFLYLSSVGVIGASGLKAIIDENTLPRPKKAYEISKYEGERIALKFHRAEGMNVTVLRPTTIFGEGKDRKSDNFDKWIRRIRAGRFYLLGTDYINTYIYVGDVVAACVFVMTHSGTGGQIYVINEPILLREFVSAISDLLEVRKVAALPTLAGRFVASLLKQTGRFGSLYNKTVFSMEKLASLGFRLPFGYREGLRRTLQWYLSMPDFWS